MMYAAGALAAYWLFKKKKPTQIGAPSAVSSLLSTLEQFDTSMSNKEMDALHGVQEQNLWEQMNAVSNTDGAEYGPLDWSTNTAGGLK